MIDRGERQQRADAEGRFSDLLSFLDMIVLPDVWTTNKHDVQLGKVPEGDKQSSYCLVPKRKSSIYDEITHISLLHTGGRNASWFSLIQFSTLTRLLLILERAVCCRTCCWPESCSAITSQSPNVGEGFFFICGRAAVDLHRSGASVFGSPQRRVEG